MKMSRLIDTHIFLKEGRTMRRRLTVASLASAVLATIVVWQLAGPQLTALAAQAKAMMKASPAAVAKGDAARKAIAEHQKALSNDGVYSCCIKPGCTFCSTAGDMCPCADNLAKGEAVCPECWGGWFAGNGRLKGVDPGKNMENVKVLPKEKMKMMYDMKAMGMQKATEGSDAK